MSNSLCLGITAEYFITVFVLKRMEAAAPEKLLEAFRVLDVDGKGIISRDYIAKLMMEEGEPFTPVKLICIRSKQQAFLISICRKNWTK